MTFKVLTSVVALAAVAGMSHQAQAEKATPYGVFSSTVGVVSQYNYRGIDRSDDHAALQANLQWAQKEMSKGLYAGVWGSTVDMVGADKEFNFYGGYRVQVADLRFDFASGLHWFPGSDNAMSYDYMETSVRVGYDFQTFDLSAGLSYSPEFLGESGDAIYMDVAASAPVGQTGLSLTTTWGSQWIDKNARYGVPDYTDWSLGAAYNWSGFDFTGKYVDTSLTEVQCPDACGAGGVFSASKTF